MRGSASTGELGGRAAKRAGTAGQQAMSRAQSEADLDSWQVREKIPSLREAVAQQGGGQEERGGGGGGGGGERGSRPLRGTSAGRRRKKKRHLKARPQSSPGKRVLSFATPSVAPASPGSGWAEQKGEQMYRAPPSPKMTHGETVMGNDVLIGQGTPIRYSVPHGSKLRGSPGAGGGGGRKVPASLPLNQHSPMKVSLESKNLLAALKEPQMQNLYVMERERQRNGTPGGASRGIGVRERWV